MLTLLIGLVHLGGGATLLVALGTYSLYTSIWTQPF